MSNNRKPPEDKPTILLRPDQIILSPEFDVRPFSNSAELAEIEDEQIEELAANIERIGQLDPLSITPDYRLIIGHRRRRAAIIINEKRTARGEPLFLLRCIVDDSGKDLRLKAIQSNLKRKPNSPMDFAYLCTQVREEFNWKGSSNTKHVAKYFDTSLASIIEYEKLLRMEKEVQNRLHAGVITTQGALELMRGIPDKSLQTEVCKRATDIQVGNELEKALEDHKNGKINLDEANRKIHELNRTRVQLPAIRQAIREARAETPDEYQRTYPLTRPELLAVIHKLESAELPDSARDFIHYLGHDIALGTGKQKELERLFWAISFHNRKKPRAR